jgi:GTP pyrophosphokinase
MLNTESKSAIELFNELKKTAESCHGEAGELLDNAFNCARELHQGQLRESGEEYIFHPVEVARITSQMHLDRESIVAALLHDVVEDTSATILDVERRFGKEIAFLVDGITKIGKFSYKSNEERQAENFRKMIVAMAKDIRVILIKLADRLHNMRTLCCLPLEKRERIAKETLEIYAPIAHRLGIGWIRSELEDLSLQYIDPKGYMGILHRLRETKDVREEYIRYVEKEIREKLSKAKINCEVKGRAKNIYSIYNKMMGKHLDFEDIYDLMAIRIITNTEKDCYLILGIIHKFYKPIPGHFKDYIALPKPNLYQSLHTTVFGPLNRVIEVQVRTQEMDNVAEEGIAAHWRYKEGGKFNELDRCFTWLRYIFESQKDLKNSRDFLDNLKIDLFENEVYIFTPKGDLKVLPEDATPIDFAYSVHTEIGNRCIGAKVNGKIVPLRYKLKSGDIVEIKTSSYKHPSKDWLSFVQTSKARSHIRQWIRREEKEEASEIGRSILSQELKKNNSSLQSFLRIKDLEKICTGFNCKEIDELFMKIGFGRLNPCSVVNKFIPLPKKGKKKVFRGKQKYSIKVKGVDEVLLRIAKCCSPLPGDEIIGFITKGRGVTVHRVDCYSIKNLGYDSDKLVEVEWVPEEKQLYPVRVSMLVLNKVGILSRVTDTISSHGINIRDVCMKNVEGEVKVILSFILDIGNKNEMEKLIGNLRKLEDIISIQRVVKGNPVDIKNIG